MATSVDVSVDPQEFRYLRQQLYGFDRELLGKLNSRVKRAVEPVRNEAESRSSVLGTITDKYGRPSGLARKYRNGKQGITVKVGGRSSRAGNDSVVRLISNNGAVAMAEFASSARTPQGEELVRRLNRFGGPGRFLWDAMDRHESDVLAQVRAEVRKTEEEFTQRLASGLSGGVVR